MNRFRPHGIPFDEVAGTAAHSMSRARARLREASSLSHPTSLITNNSEPNLPPEPPDPLTPDYPHSNWPKPQSPDCLYDTIPGSKSCLFPEPRFPRNAIAIGFSPCEVAKLRWAYIRAYRIALWAREFMRALRQLPMSLRVLVWTTMLDNSVGPPDKRHPLVDYFGAYTQSHHDVIQTVLDRLLQRFLNGPLQFRARKPWLVGCIDNATVALQKSSSEIVICIEQFMQTGRDYAAQAVMHELMHRLVANLDDQKLQSGAKAYGERVWTLAKQYPLRTLYNIETYTVWASRMFLAVWEPGCNLFPGGLSEQSCTGSGAFLQCTHTSYMFKMKPPGWVVKVEHSPFQFNS